MMTWRRPAYSLLHLFIVKDSFSCKNGLVSAKTNHNFHSRCVAELSVPINSYAVRRISHIRTMANSKFRGIGCVKRSLHSYSNDDDDFAELGPPIGQGIRRIRELMTEKPERIMHWKPYRPKSLSSASSLPAEGSHSVKDALLNSGISSAALHLKLENHSDHSRHEFVNKGAPKFNSLNSVTIENVPSILKLSQLKEAMLTFGNVSNASIRVIPNGLDCCDVEFESVESRRRAIASGQFSVKNFDLSISRLHVLHTVTIRIKNICSVTPDSAIHSMCMSCGPLEGFSRTKDDIVDALFRVKDNSDEQCILKMLNNTTMDDCKWSAILELKESTPVVVTDSNRNDSRCQLGYQIGSQIDDLKRQLNVKRVQLQDLEYLHHALVHLQHQPDPQ